MCGFRGDSHDKWRTPPRLHALGHATVAIESEHWDTPVSVSRKLGIDLSGVRRLKQEWLEYGRVSHEPILRFEGRDVAS
jgi:hypothetical protein